MRVIFKESVEHQGFNVMGEVGHPAVLKAGCSNCKVRGLCLSKGLSPREVDRVDELVGVRRKVRRGETLVRYGEKFVNLYAIRTGFFKTSVSVEDGREQVTGFQMAGEHLGMDGIVDEQHISNAVALEDAEVCVMHFARLEQLAREVPDLQRHLYKVLSQEIVREHGVMMLIGSRRSEERIASFLLNLMQRMHARGFSPSELVLRMTREELGSFLCLTLETVSRVFSKFANQGILEVRHRHVRLLDLAALRRVVHPVVTLPQIAFHELQPVAAWGPQTSAWQQLATGAC